jgi:hypothetical protein
VFDQRKVLVQGTLDMLILRTLALGPNHGVGVSRSRSLSRRQVRFVRFRARRRVFTMGVPRTERRTAALRYPVSPLVIR